MAKHRVGRKSDIGEVTMTVTMKTTERNNRSMVEIGNKSLGGDNSNDSINHDIGNDTNNGNDKMNANVNHSVSINSKSKSHDGDFRLLVLRIHVKFEKPKLNSSSDFLFDFRRRERVSCV